MRSSSIPPVSLAPTSLLALTRSIARHWQSLMLGVYLLLIPLAYWLAFAIRFDGSIPARYLALYWETLPSLAILRLSCLATWGLHRGRPRHAGIHDLTALLGAITLSSTLFIPLLLLLGHSERFPRSILVLDWASAILLCGGVLFLLRMLREIRSGWLGPAAGKRTLLIGAGDAAAGLLHDLRNGTIRGIFPIGLVDDNPVLRGVRIHGIPVLGSTRALKELVSRHRVQLLVIAIPSATSSQLQTIVERCVETGIEFKIIPSLEELLQGGARPLQPRDVRVEDLLRRGAVELDLSNAHLLISGEVVLVTGGAGSIGSELARQIARLKPAALILLDQAESPLYFTQLEIARGHPDLVLIPIIADIANRDVLERIFATYRPAYVFHAAAYKHVPLMEIHLEEAVRNNVVGTLHLAECAVHHGAQHFVLISSDKAVRPSSVMGATKRIAERIILELQRLQGGRTTFRAVRFGNVLGSDGSVIPLFKRQIAAGGPVTVTHAEMTRYFMTIPEATRLVLLAATLTETGGRVAMLEMGAPVRIVELAESLIRLSGFEPHRDVPIVFTGIRPGEKLHEELLSEVERTVPTLIDKIRIVETAPGSGHVVEGGLAQLISGLGAHDPAEIRAAILMLVPECVEPLRSLVRDTPALPPRPSRPISVAGR